MNYKNALQVIDPLKALGIMKMEPELSGGYVRFLCHCGSQAYAKSFGVKKNLWFCPACEKGGNIISLYIKQMGVQYAEAVKQLVERAGTAQEPIKDELTLNYELEYSKDLSKFNISEEFCKEYGIGVPKGKTMLSGCLAFTVKNEEGMKIAYYGINLKSGKPVFHKSFNPENYLYNIHRANAEAILTTNFYDWIRFTLDGKTAICNFSLPYLSTRQQSLIRKLERITIYSYEMLEFLKGFEEITLSK